MARAESADKVRDAVLSGAPKLMGRPSKVLVVVDQFEEFRTSPQAAAYVEALRHSGARLAYGPLIRPGRAPVGVEGWGNSPTFQFLPRGQPEGHSSGCKDAWKIPTFHLPPWSRSHGWR